MKSPDFWRMAIALVAVVPTAIDAAAARPGIDSEEPMSRSTTPLRATGRQLTHASHGHILTNIGVWSADGRWIFCDVRSDPAGSVFDGQSIQRVNVETGQVQTLYTSGRGAHCGVVTVAPKDDRVVFIHGPEAPTPDWSYAACHRRGAIVHADAPGDAVNLDARDLTLPFTADRKYPGLEGPRHWPRSSPDGSRIGLLMRDDAGVVQLWTISPNGGVPKQLTHNVHDIASTFTWSPNGRWIAHAMDNSICVTEVSSGVTRRLTPPADAAHAPRPEACVFSPGGNQIAYVRPVTSEGKTWNQIFVLTLPGIDR